MAPLTSKKKCNLKQGNLSSFLLIYKKKKKKKNSSIVTKKNNNNNQATSKVLIPFHKLPLKNMFYQPKNKIWSKLKPGSKVAVLWPDNKYYECTVVIQHKNYLSH